MYDERLVRAAQEGDEAAFAALYDRAVDSVYDLAWSLTGDAEEAARLVEAAFVLAARNIDQISEPSQVRPWLLAIAGDQALADDEDGVLRSGWDNHPDHAVDDEPLGQLALRRWAADATSVLALADQLVVELQVRHDLDPDQLAAAVGCGLDQLPDVLARVDAEASSVLSALILARQGRKSCKSLAKLLAKWDGSPSVDFAEIADKHSTTCSRCARRRKLVDPLELVGEAPLIAAPAALRTPILERVAAELAPRAGRTARADATQAMPVVGAVGGRGGGPRGGGPRGGVAVGDDAPRVPMAALVGAGVVLLVLVVAVLVALNLGGSPGSSSLAVGSTATTDAANNLPAPTLAPFDTTTSTSLAPGSVLALNSGLANLGATATSAQLVLTNSGATGTSWTASSVVSWITVSPASGFLGAGKTVAVSLALDRGAAPNGDFDTRVVFAGSDQGGRSATVEVTGKNTQSTTTPAPTTTVVNKLTVTASASPSTIYTAPCPIPTRAVNAQVTATVGDTAGTPSVALSYKMPDGSSGTEQMGATSDGGWEVGLPASSTAGTITFVVKATDAGVTQSTSGSVSVLDCSS